MSAFSMFTGKRAIVLAGALVVAGLAGSPMAVSPAQAQAGSCGEDIGKIQQRRGAIIAQLNTMAKAAKGKLDPIASCPRLRSLAAVEGELVSYMTKNKDWCNIPDNIMENVTAGRSKTANLAGQACKIAGQMRKMQQQQAQGGGMSAPQAQRLPTGPL